MGNCPTWIQISVTSCVIMVCPIHLFGPQVFVCEMAMMPAAVSHWAPYIPGVDGSFPPLALHSALHSESPFQHSYVPGTT